MTRMTGPDCAVMCNLINIYKHTYTQPPLSRLIRGFRYKYHCQCEWHIMTRMTGPDCAVMCNLINTHTHTQTHTRTDFSDFRTDSVRNATTTRTRISDRYFSLFQQEMTKGGIAVTDGLLSRPETGVNQSLSQPTKCIPTDGAQSPRAHETASSIVCGS